jgi:hypothetical protein
MATHFELFEEALSLWRSRADRLAGGGFSLSEARELGLSVGARTEMFLKTAVVPNLPPKLEFDGAINALKRSIRLRKSIEMSRFSANCCWVIPRRLRIERSFLPNCFRKVATSAVWLSRLQKNTEHYYGFRVHPEITTQLPESGAGQLRHPQDSAGPPVAPERPRYHLHFTPTHASWLNQVERWFALLTQRQIKRGSHTSVQELEAAIRVFITALHQT